MEALEISWEWRVQFESSDAAAQEMPPSCPQQACSGGKKGRKQVAIYKQVLSAAEALASFVSTHRDTDLGTYVSNLISVMEAELRVGKLPVLQTTTTPAQYFRMWNLIKLSITTR